MIISFSLPKETFSFEGYMKGICFIYNMEDIIALFKKLVKKFKLCEREYNGRRVSIPPQVPRPFFKGFLKV